MATKQHNALTLNFTTPHFECLHYNMSQELFEYSVCVVLSFNVYAKGISDLYTPFLIILNFTVYLPWPVVGFVLSEILCWSFCVPFFHSDVLAPCSSSCKTGLKVKRSQGCWLSENEGLGAEGQLRSGHYPSLAAVLQHRECIFSSLLVCRISGRRLQVDISKFLHMGVASIPLLLFLLCLSVLNVYIMYVVTLCTGWFCVST